MPIFDRPVSGRETLSQLVFVLALHFVQHLDGSPPGHGQPVQTHCCSYLQPQRWPTSAHAMSRPGSDDSPGSSPLAAPAAAAEEELDVAPPPGFTWTLKCIRSGAASAAAAIDISLSKIRRQGDWSASSMVPERKYIDAMVVSTDAARRFFGWLSHGA